MNAELPLRAGVCNRLPLRDQFWRLALLSLKHRLKGHPAPIEDASNTEANVVDLSEVIEWENDARQQGMLRGFEPLMHLFERKLRRTLSQAEHETLRARLVAGGAVRLGDVVLDLDAAAFEVWITDPTAS